MEAEQRRLYNHFVALSKNGKTDEQRANCKKYAAEILASFPQFLKPVEKPVEKPKPKEVKK